MQQKSLELQEMKDVVIKEATTRKAMNDFIALPRKIYAGNSCYVPDLDIDVRNTFDPMKNAGLEHSDIVPFVAYDVEGNVVGRIAGIINHKANEKWQTRCVRFSMIEFIDDEKVSQALIEAVAEWGCERGMTQIQGPMGISDFDKEGMLVEDFDLCGSMITIYNPPYYPQHMERLGFEKEVDWVQIQVPVPTEVPPLFNRIATRSLDMLGLKLRKVTRKELTKGGYAQHIFELLNRAYSPLFGFTELSKRQVEDFSKTYIPLVDPRFISAVEDKKENLVGIAITMNSLNKALQKSRGRLFPFGWFHLLRSLKWKHEDKVELMLIAVHPDYQGKGVNAAFFADLIPVYNSCGITWAETGPQLEDNIRELSQWRILGPKYVKRRRCYTRKIIRGQE